MAIILDLRQGAAPEDQLIYLKEQLERFLTELEDRGGGVQSIQMIPGEDSLKLIVTDMTGEVSEAEIQNANNIVTIAMQYYLSTSPSEPTGSATGWQSDPPTPVEGKYIWQRSIIIWADGSSASTTPVCPETAAKALTKAGEALTKAQQAERDAATAATAASNAEASASSAASSASDAQTQATAAAGSASAAAASASSADSHANASALAAGRSATSALEAAQSASDAAGSASAAQSSADAAAGAANTAAQRASEANRKAEAASDSAAQAEREASRAGSYATGALNNLSTVQDIIGVLNWVGDRVVYTWDYPMEWKDKNYDPSKQYFTVTPTHVVNPVAEDYYKYYLPLAMQGNIGYEWVYLDKVDDSKYNPDEQYYTVVATKVTNPTIEEYQNNEYYVVVSQPSPYDRQTSYMGWDWAVYHGAFNPSTTYYTLSAQSVPKSESTKSNYWKYYTKFGFDVITGWKLASKIEHFDPTHYYTTLEATPVLINENSKEDHTNGLYYTMEPDSAQQAMADFIKAHLALNDEGLYVLKGENDWRVLVANDGVYIIDAQGRRIARYQDSITLGTNDGSHVDITTEAISFNIGNKTYAYAAQDKFFMINSEISGALYIGDYSIRQKSNGKLVIGRRR